MAKKKGLEEFLAFYNKSRMADLPPDVADLVRQGRLSEAAAAMAENAKLVQSQSRVRSMADLGPQKPPPAHNPDAGPRRYYPQGTGMIVRESPGPVAIPTIRIPGSSKSPTAGGAVDPTAVGDAVDVAGRQADFIDRLMARLAPLSPVSMKVERENFLPGDFAVDDTAGDAVRKILGYGVIPGAAVGLAARQLADDGFFPAVRDDQEEEQPPVPAYPTRRRVGPVSSSSRRK